MLEYVFRDFEVFINLTLEVIAVHMHPHFQTLLNVGFRLTGRIVNDFLNRESEVESVLEFAGGCTFDAEPHLLSDLHEGRNGVGLHSDGIVDAGEGIRDRLKSLAEEGKVIYEGNRSGGVRGREEGKEGG